MRTPDRHLVDEAADVVRAFHRTRPTSIDDAVAALGPLARRRAPARVRRTRLDGVAGSLVALLADAAAVVVDGAVPPAVLRRWQTALDAAPTLGSAIDAGRIVPTSWFAAVVTEPDPDGRVRGYQRAVERGAADLALVAPDLHARCAELTASLLGGTVRTRAGFGGPGFVEFGGIEAVDRDGDVHLDWEGLAAADPLGLFDEAYSFVLMVRPPEEGGDLRVWGIGAGGDDLGAVGEPGPGALVGYRPGTLVAFPAQDLHQITALRGDRSRITVTWHARRAGPAPDDGWEIWL